MYFQANVFGRDAEPCWSEYYFIAALSLSGVFETFRKAANVSCRIQVESVWVPVMNPHAFLSSRSHAE